MGKAKNKNKYGSPYGKGEGQKTSCDRDGARTHKERATTPKEKEFEKEFLALLAGSAAAEKACPESVAKSVAELVSFARGMPDRAEGVSLLAGGLFSLSFVSKGRPGFFGYRNLGLSAQLNFNSMARIYGDRTIVLGREIAEAALGPMLCLFDESARIPISFDNETNVLRFASPAETLALREEQKFLAYMAPATAPSRSAAL